MVENCSTIISDAEVIFGNERKLYKKTVVAL